MKNIITTLLITLVSSMFLTSCGAIGDIYVSVFEGIFLVIFGIAFKLFLVSGLFRRNNIKLTQ